MNDISKKMEIEQDSNPLSVYFFTVQGGSMMIEIAEDFKSVMAYTELDAFNKIRQDYPAGTLINIKKRGQIEVKKIINAINIQSATPQEVKINIAPPVPQEKTFKDFIYGMLLVADKFVENKRDRATMKRIISKINLQNER